jgi:hypothetical protein
MGITPSLNGGVKSRMPQKEKKEVKIEPIFVPYLKEPEIIKDTINVERQHVFEVTRRVGKRLSGLMIAIGAMLSILCLQYLFSPLLNIGSPPTLETLFTSGFLVFIAGFLGVINIICGFVLLAKE